MVKVYGALSYACGSLAIALLAVALLAGGGQTATADPGNGGEFGADCDALGFLFPCEWFTDCMPSRPNCRLAAGTTSYCACTANP